MKKLARVKSVQVLEKRRVRLAFSNGVVREVDLRPYLRGPVFKAIRESDKAFRTVRVDIQLGTIVWANGADMDPDVLYGSHSPAWATEEKAGSLSVRESQAGYRKRKG